MVVNDIYILGDIGDDEGEVSLEFVTSQYNPSANLVKVYIDSDGGNVRTGLSIMDFLQGIPQDVHTVGIGMVASIATMPFLAGKVRELKPNAQFLAHLPSLVDFSGNTDDFKKATEYMDSVQKRMANIYSKYTGMSIENLEDFMRKDTPIFAHKAKDMGFATHVDEYKAVAKLNRFEMDKKKEPSKLDIISAKISDFFDGVINEIDNPEKEEEEKDDVIELKSGKKVTIKDGKAYLEDGSPIDEGIYSTNDGRSLHVSASGDYSIDEEKEIEDKVNSLKESLEVSSKEVDDLKNKIQELEISNKSKDDQIQSLELENSNKIKSLESKLDKVMSMTIGGEPVVSKANIKPYSINKVESKGHKLDGLAKKLTR